MKAKNKLSKEEESTINNILDSIRKTDKKVYIGDADSDLLKNITIEDVYEVGISQPESADVEYRLVINDIKSNDKSLFMSDILSKDLIKKYNGMYKELCSNEYKELFSEENKNKGLEEFFSYINSENDIDKYKEYLKKELIGDINDFEKITPSEYPDNIFYRKNGEVILDYDIKHKYFAIYNNDNIWKKYEEIYGFDYTNMYKLLISVLDEAFDLDVLKAGIGPTTKFEELVIGKNIQEKY